MAIEALTAMLHVGSVPRSIAFYEMLGFAATNTVAAEGSDQPTWAWLTSGGAQLMVATADVPVVPSQQAVLFYLYCPDVASFRSELMARGVSVGPIAYPFYAPRGEFRVHDPDGYVLMISHT